MMTMMMLKVVVVVIQQQLPNNSRFCWAWGSISTYLEPQALVCYKSMPKQKLHSTNQCNKVVNASGLMYPKGLDLSLFDEARGVNISGYCDGFDS